MKKVILKRLLPYLYPYKKHIFIVLSLSLINVILSLINPILIGKAIDTMVCINQVDFTRLCYLLVLLFFITVGIILSDYFCIKNANQLAYHVIHDLRVELFQKVQYLPITYLDSITHGQMMSRILFDVDVVSEGLLQGMKNIFSGLLTIILTLVFMIILNFKIAMIVFFMTPLSLLVASLIAKFSYRSLRTQMRLRGDMVGYIEEYIGQIKLVKSYGYEKRSQDTFAKMNQEYQDMAVKAQTLSAITGPSTRVVNGLVYSAVGVYGAICVIQGKVSVGVLSSFLSYTHHYTKPFNEISAVISELQSAIVALERIFNVLDESNELDQGKKQLETINGKIDFEKIYFSYGEQPFIQNLNLSIQPGQKIAIVGPTGCGKTTLINLLMRFYLPQSGTIKIDQVPIQKIPLNQLRQSFGMVLQDTWIFNGTIKENIIYGNKQVSEDQLNQVIEKVHLKSFIERLPKGYDTYIEDANQLSMGQKQLISIARVMLKNPPMLILDEATSSIDTLTQVQVQNAFEQIMQGRTSLIVAHRLSTIKNADQIIVMKEGKIVEMGNHSTLLKQNGFYASLYESQFEK